MEKYPPRPTGKGPASSFTGDVYADVIAPGSDPARLVASHVRFAPGARTHWHSHPFGQTLHCTAGVGLVATRDGRVLALRPGETVWAPPGEEHWHGGTSDNFMCHLVMLQADETGSSTTWLEAVTDEEYTAAHEALGG